MRHLSAVLLTLVTSWTASGQTYTISTFAGGALPVNIPGTSASLYGPQGVAVDKAGDVFFTDLYAVLRLDGTTGVLTLVAGTNIGGFSGDNGPATSAQLNHPLGIALDSAGNLYIADSGNYRIRKVSNGVITTVAGIGLSPTCCFSGDGAAAISAELNQPTDVAVDAAGNLYIADNGNHRIRKVFNGVITTVAGNGTIGSGGDSGPATSAQLYNPEGITVDSAGNIYIADTANNRIRKISNGVIMTVAGTGTSGFSGDGGPATSAQLAFPESVAVDTVGNLYVADAGNSRIRKVSNGVITTVAGGGTSFGDNGPAVGAQLSLAPFYEPRSGVAVDSANNLYIADTLNRRIRKVSNGVITTLAGNGAAGFSGDNGPSNKAQLNNPEGVAIDASGNLYIADTGSNHIRKVSNGAITTVAGSGTDGFSGDNGPATSSQLSQPAGVAVDSVGNLYIDDAGNNRIRKISNGVITTIAGDGFGPGIGDNGPATSASLGYPKGLAVDSAGNVYIADTNNSRIRKVSNGVITTVAGTGTSGFSGDGGPATSAQLAFPESVAVDATGNLYILDSFNYRIRKVSNGVITTVAGSGTGGFSGDNGPATSAQLGANSFGLAVDSAGNLYIADTGNGRIRKVSNGVITSIAGGGSSFGDNGPATIAQLNAPQGVVVDSAGKVYIADSFNNSVRALTPGVVPAIAQSGIVPIYSSAPVIQPGSWASIYGNSLANGNYLWNGDFPTSLGGTSVTIDNKPAYLWVVGPTQINVQAPDDTATGLVSVVVNTPYGTAASTVTLAPYGPSFNVLGDGKHVAGEIATPNGSGAYGSGAYDLVGPSNTFSYSTRPVKAGETLTLYGVGFGPTTPHVLAGQIFSGAASTNTPVTITIGGVNANVSFAGITEAGLYQFNLIVPPNTGSGDQPLQAAVNGVQIPAGRVVTVQ
jgi:uncharacterized protein (TIGR03437 family)